MFFCMAASLGLATETPAQQAGANGRQAQAPEKQTATQQTTGQQKQATRAPAIPPGMRLLSLKEGRAIAQKIAWANDEEGLAPDCSHLVHDLYEQAGYPYSYASSTALYRGARHFLRVRFPHPGDLIVWRGHVGIVIDPREHTFFSSVSTGAQVQDYTSAYWRARGHARFYRYLTKAKSTESILEASGS